MWGDPAVSRNAHVSAEIASNPISVAELLAENRNWNFRRDSEDEIDVALEGQWKVYSASLQWSGCYGILAIDCSFEFKLDTEEKPEFMKVLNLVNMRSWLGSFTHEEELNSVVYGYRLALEEPADISFDQFGRIMDTVVAECDRFYPSLDLVRLGMMTAADSLEATIIDTSGTA